MNKIAAVALFFLFCAFLNAQHMGQWLGPQRNGVYAETGLLKQWPDGGPELLWSEINLDDGYSSPVVYDNTVYVTGRSGDDEYIMAMSTAGQRLWRIPFGKGTSFSYPESRSTPTVEGDYLYLISGAGEVVCVGRYRRKVMWTVPAFETFGGACWQWGLAESPLLVDDKVIFTPGGHQTTMVALDKKTGETIWQSPTLHDSTAFVSPIQVERGGHKIIVQVLVKYIIGVNAENGEILWTVNYSEIEPTMIHPWMPKNNCVTPHYHDGRIFVTSGYDHVGLMLELAQDGASVRQIWTNADLDCHHGQVVRVGDCIYGSNWLDNRRGNWCCIAWDDGVTQYETSWQTKGPIISADGMLYCLDEKEGHLALVRATPKGFDPVSVFRVPLGGGPYWALPVIHDGVLYLRHGRALMAYRIR